MFEWNLTASLLANTAGRSWSIAWLCVCHISRWSRLYNRAGALEHNTVKYRRSWCKMCAQTTAVAGVQGPWNHQQHMALLWNPPRHLYRHQEKSSRHAHQGSVVMHENAGLHVIRTDQHTLQGAGPSPVQLGPVTVWLTELFAEGIDWCQRATCVKAHGN